tara:strand:+ start:127 stop:450 length:324 start_codon:yes stop_codon:yes gene_type:complete
MLKVHTGSRLSEASRLGRSSDVVRESNSGQAFTTLRGNQRRKLVKHHDPFDLPEEEKKELKKKTNKSLTKQKVLAIIDLEMRIFQMNPAIRRILESIRYKVGKIQDE